MPLRPSHFVTFALGAACAVAVTAQAATPRPGKRFAALDTFGQVLATIERSYVERVDERRLVWGAAKGMVRALDPHSEFLTPEELAQLREDTQGEFGGVGMVLDPATTGLLVREVFPDTPAARGGCKAGDLILAVDGHTVSSIDDAISRLRGKPGTKVTLRLERDRAVREVELVRELIKVRAVTARELDGGVLYLRLAQFQERAAADLTAAVAAYEQAHGAPRGLVLDLRGNPGGLLAEAVDVSDLFLDDGVIVSTRGRGGAELDSSSASRGDIVHGAPIVVLVDGSTASASEIVAGALKDHGRARLVGVRSYGKGSVQTIFSFADGSGMKLTVARYYTPSGRCIQELGILPDVEILPVDAAALAKAREASRGSREEDLDGHLANAAGQGAVTKPRVAGKPGSAGASAGANTGADLQLDVAADLVRALARK